MMQFILASANSSSARMEPAALDTSSAVPLAKVPAIRRHSLFGGIPRSPAPSTAIGPSKPALLPTPRRFSLHCASSDDHSGVGVATPTRAFRRQSFQAQKLRRSDSDSAAAAAAARPDPGSWPALDDLGLDGPTGLPSSSTAAFEFLDALGLSELDVPETLPSVPAPPSREAASMMTVLGLTKEEVTTRGRLGSASRLNLDQVVGTGLGALENLGLDPREAGGNVVAGLRALFGEEELSRNGQAVISFLSWLGISDDDVARMVTAYPKLLKMDVEGQLWPKVYFLFEMAPNTSPDDLVRFPRFFMYDLKTRIMPRLAFLRERRSGFRSLSTVLTPRDNSFATKVAHASPEEFESFVASMSAFRTTPARPSDLHAPPSDPRSDLP